MVARRRAIHPCPPDPVSRDGTTIMSPRRLPALLRRLTAACAAGALLASCMSNPQTASITAQPKTPAVKTLTSFTQALRCMDDLFARYGKTDIIITSAGLPDATGQIQTGTKEMMISAISKMSVKSNAFRFVDYDPTQLGVQDLHNLIGVRTDLGFDIPRYYIRGAITQLDAGVASDSMGGGIALPGLALGASQDQIVSVVSMDMNVGDMITRQILPGMQATNSISVVRSGKGGDVDGQIGKAGFFFEMSMDRSEGTHQSVRTLVELSLIETLGKLTKVPYWTCLDIPQTNPEMMEQAREWYDRMTPDQRTVMAQTALVNAGYLGGPPTGAMDQATREALGRYQAEHDLIADGRVTFDLYYSFLANNLAARVPDPEETAKDRAQAVLASAPATAARLGTPVQVKLTTDRGARPSYKVGDSLRVSVGVTDDAYVYCYYQDGNGTIARIFPNRFSPDAYLTAAKTVTVPSPQAGFDIVFERPGATERVDCVASRREVGIGLSRDLMVPDLTPIPGRTMDSIVREYKRIDQAGLSHQTLSLPVAR